MTQPIYEKLVDAMRLDECLLVRLLHTEDIKEVLTVFPEKRKPIFKTR
jgi:hypothetical protein